MRIIYVGPAAEVFVPALDGIVPSGVAVEVDDELARSLCEQVDNWQPAPLATGGVFTAPADNGLALLRDGEQITPPADWGDQIVTTSTPSLDEE